MCGNLALQSLRFGADICNFDVDLVQRPAFLSQFAFLAIDLAPGCLFRGRNLFNVSPAASEIGVERSELFFRVMRLKHAQVGVQCLITSRFAGLALQRADLPLHLFDDVADAKQICLGCFEFAQSFLLL